MVGNEWSDDHKSPKSIGGKNTQSVHVQLNVGDDIDAHCAKARAAGAEIIAEPETQFYGDRSSRAKDPEGHIWTFGLQAEEMSAGGGGTAGGLTPKKIEQAARRGRGGPYG